MTPSRREVLLGKIVEYGRYCADHRTIHDIGASRIEAELLTLSLSGGEMPPPQPFPAMSFNWRCAFGLHPWGKWLKAMIKTTESAGQSAVGQIRNCPRCNREEWRLVEVQRS